MKTIHSTASIPAWLRVLLLAALAVSVACKENSGASSPSGGGSPSSGGVSGGGMPSPGGSSGGGTTGSSGGAPGMPSPGGGSSGDSSSRGPSGGATGEMGGARGSSGSGAGMSSPSGGAGTEIPAPGGGSSDGGGPGNQSGSDGESDGDSDGTGDCGGAGGLPGGVGGMGQDGDCLGGGRVGEIPGESDAERAGRLGQVLDESLGDFDQVLHEEQQEVAAVGRNTEGFGGGGSRGGIGLGEQAAGSGGSVAVINESAVRPESPTASMSEDEIRERTPDDVPMAADDDIIARQLREAALAEEDAALRERLWDEYRKYKGL